MVSSGFLVSRRIRLDEWLGLVESLSCAGYYRPLIQTGCKRVAFATYHAELSCLFKYLKLIAIVILSLRLSGNFCDGLECLYVKYKNQHYLSHDVASERDNTPCNEIDKLLVVYSFSNVNDGEILAFSRQKCDF